MGDVTSAMAHLVGTLAGLGVELDRSRLCRHAMRLLAQPPRRYRSRASSIMSWATCVEQQAYVRGRITDPFPEDPRALEERPLDEPPVPRTERSDRYRGSYTGKPSGRAFVADPRHVVLPYVDGLVKARVSREVGYVFRVTVRREPDGKYYASAVSKRPVPRTAPSRDRAVVVASLGTEVLVELDDGTTWDAPKSWERSQERLREADRLLFSLGEGTPERERLRLRRARLHAHVANIRKDYIHKLTNEITRDYAEVVVPRPNFADVAEQADESALVNDAAWGELVRQLEYKCKWRGRAFRKAGGYEVVDDGGRPVVRPA